MKNIKTTEKFDDGKEVFDQSNEKKASISKFTSVKTSKKHDRLKKQHKKLKKHLVLQSIFERKTLQRFVNSKKKICNLTSIDAALLIQGEIFIFKVFFWL